ncbi:hypothetical protein [Pseudomonas aeruginosa]|uniref:hypothetical protein n=1 Tax=Pseudomonas aeruginosa TaxID=287 RepID=UPI001784A7F4|nr:hypothetical protein [Pseudomonas aeruginosa]
MSSTQHQLIEQCATRLRGIVEALDNIHDNTPHRWSTDLDDVHSSAESLLALIKDQAPARSEASFEEWLANELEGEDGQPVPAAACDITLARRAFNHWPKLEQPAKVGGVRFSAGVSSRLVVEAAQRLYEFESTPEKEAERIDPEQESVEQAGGDERAAFERAFTVQEGIYFDDKRGEYRSMNLRAIEATDAQDLNLRLQGWQARAALAQPSPVRSSLLINGYQLRAALDFIAPDGTAEQLESEACIEWRQQDADFLEAGLYAFCAEYPEEGGVLLDEEPTTAQPSPLQSEQAEAERPAVVGYRSMESGMVYEQDYGLKDPEALTTVAECDSIVGELRAEIAQLRQHKNDYMDAGQETYRALQNEIREREAEIARLDGLVSGRTAERDAALAEVERLRESKGDPSGSFDRCMKMMYERDENAKRLDAALARVAELEAKLAELEKQEPVSTEHLPMHIAYARAKHEVFLGSCQEDVFRFALIDLLQESPLYAAPVAQAQHSVPDVCDGKEQDAFEQWARKEGLDTSCHPMHWLFLDAKTNSARQGWKAALRYVRSQLAAAPQPVAEGE